MPPPVSIPLTDFVKSSKFLGKLPESLGKNPSKEIGVDSLIETGKCDLLIQNIKGQQFDKMH